MRTPFARCSIAVVAAALLLAGPVQSRQSVTVAAASDLVYCLEELNSEFRKRHPEIDLRAVTTVSGDTTIRGHIAARLLAVAGESGVEVAAGVRVDADAPNWMGHEGEGLEPGPEVTLSQRSGVDVLCSAENAVIATIGMQSNVAAAVQPLGITTFAVSGGGAPAVTSTGLVLGAARAHRIPVVSQLAAAYVEVIRNTPILVQIFMLYYALPQFEIRLDAFTVAWLAVTIWGGAYNTENFRAGFEAVPLRYREAGAALGFRSVATFLNITLPIGGRIALPSSINTYISVLKNTSLMYVIGYHEFATTTLNLNALLQRTPEALTLLAVVYLTLVWPLSAAIRYVEGHLALPERA